MSVAGECKGKIAEDRRQKTEGRGQMTEVYPPLTGQRIENRAMSVSEWIISRKQTTGRYRT
jgi:hypothetical protein